MSPARPTVKTPKQVRVPFHPCRIPAFARHRSVLYPGYQRPHVVIGTYLATPSILQLRQWVAQRPLLSPITPVAWAERTSG